jgi:hypothetical protein
MRRRALASLAVAIATSAIAASTPGCAPDHGCREGTLLLGITLGGQALDADSVTVHVTVAGEQTVTTSLPLPHTPNIGLGSVEVDFPHGYHAGAMIDLTVDATVAGALLASYSVQTTLGSGCTATLLDFTNLDGGACQPLVCPPGACGALDDGCGGTLACPPC